MNEFLMSPLGEQAIDLVKLILLAFLLWVGNKGLQLYERVSKTRASAEQRAQVAEAIRRVASLANEQADKLKKGLTATGPITSAQKMTVAKDAARTWWPELFDKMPDAKLEALIESELPVLRSIAPPPVDLSAPPAVSLRPPPQL